MHTSTFYLDKLISNLIEVWFVLVLSFIEISVFSASCVDPDQTRRLM